MIFCIAFLPISAIASDDATKLKNIEHQIHQVKTDLTKKEKQQTSVKQQLNTLKKKIAALTKKYHETSKNLKKQKNVLTKLTKNQTKEQLKLKEAQLKLASQIKLAYQVESPNYLKDIFGEEKTITPDLLLAYHSYIFTARLEQMRYINKTLNKIAQNRQKIKQQTKDLERLENKQNQQKIELEKARKEQNNILNSLKNKIVSQNKKLKGLLAAKKNLERLIAKLTARKLTAMSPETKALVCRNFVWPTKGGIVTHFGSPIEQSSWTWNGVIIRAAENQPIHAMASGKVIYADWFTGYGLLMIIDHQNGYMSLYGYNNRLRKDLHASVTAGEIIANVGKTDTEKPALYFAIRYNGKPIDPEKWCR